MTRPEDMDDPLDRPVLTPKLAKHIAKQATIPDTPEARAALEQRLRKIAEEREARQRIPQLSLPEKAARIAIAGEDGAEDGDITAAIRDQLSRNHVAKDPQVKEVLVRGMVSMIRAFDEANHLPGASHQEAQQLRDGAVLAVCDQLEQLPGIDRQGAQGIIATVIAPAIRMAGRLGIPAQVSHTLFMTRREPSGAAVTAGTPSLSR